MRKINLLLQKYGESHQNSTNKLIHWFCIPAIMFSIVGILLSVPFPLEKSWWLHWGSILLLLSLIYYLRLSFPMFLGFVVIALLLLWGNWMVYSAIFGDQVIMLIISLVIFVLAWIVQFIGHKIEGKKPSFLEDVQFLLIGPAWLLHFIYGRLGLNY